MLTHVQELLVASCWAQDPVADLAQRVAAAPEDRLTAEERAQLLALDRDGLRITGRIVRELRLERILRGSADAAKAYAEDPAGFSEEFVTWCSTSSSGSVFPSDEADAWNNR